MPSVDTGKIHVGVDASCWNNNRGYGRFTRELIGALAQRESRFQYSLIFDQTPKFQVPDTITQVVVGTSRSMAEASSGNQSRSLRFLLRMAATVRAENLDLFFFPAVYSYFPLLTQIPRVVCYHDAIAERYPHLLFPTKMNHRLWQVKTQLAKWQTARAMTISQSSAEDLEKILKIDKSKIDVVSEGFDPIFRITDEPDINTSMRGKYGIPDDTPLLMCLGGMNAHKNIDRLIQAMNLVIAQRSDIHLAIVGDTSGGGFWDNVPELRELVQSNSLLAKRVHFTGYVPDEELVYLMNSATGLIFPSLCEGFGLPAVEAMACGLPVIASNRGSLPEVIGDAGIYFNPENVEEIASQVLRFFADGDLRLDLKKRAPTQAAGFTWERAARLAEKCFENALG